MVCAVYRQWLRSHFSVVKTSVACRPCLSWWVTACAWVSSSLAAVFRKSRRRPPLHFTAPRDQRFVLLSYTPSHAAFLHHVPILVLSSYASFQCCLIPYARAQDEDNTKVLETSFHVAGRMTSAHAQDVNCVAWNPVHGYVGTLALVCRLLHLVLSRRQPPPFSFSFSRPLFPLSGGLVRRVVSLLLGASEGSAMARDYSDLIPMALIVFGFGSLACPPTPPQRHYGLVL